MKKLFSVFLVIIIFPIVGLSQKEFVIKATTYKNSNDKDYFLIGGGSKCDVIIKLVDTKDFSYFDIGNSKKEKLIIDKLLIDKKEYDKDGNICHVLTYKCVDMSDVNCIVELNACPTTSKVIFSANFGTFEYTYSGSQLVSQKPLQ